MITEVEQSRYDKIDALVQNSVRMHDSFAGDSAGLQSVLEGIKQPENELLLFTNGKCELVTSSEIPEQFEAKLNNVMNVAQKLSM